METKSIKALQREILLGFWKTHILYHAAKRPLIGQWMLRELRRHGFEVSPGTIYPLLARMEERGWLICRTDPRGGLRARKEYSLTESGREVLSLLRKQVEELHREIILGKDEQESGS